MTITSEKLNTKCGKCSHKASSHNYKGKHECLVYGCVCGWFKLPEENNDGNLQ